MLRPKREWDITVWRGTWGTCKCILYGKTLISCPLNFCFPWIYAVNLWSLQKGCKINVKISLNLCILTFTFSTIVHLNFEVLTAEIPVILCAFLYVKLLTIKCYDWSRELANKMCTASVVRMNSANKTNVGNKQANPSQTIPLMFALL